MIDYVHTFKQNVHCDDWKVLKKTKQHFSLLKFYFSATKANLSCISE